MEDVSDVVSKEPSRKKQVELVRKKLSRERKDDTGWSMRSFPRFNVAYVVPPAVVGEEKKTSFLYRYTRSLVLGAFNNFVFLQETENEKLKDKT